jgi:hypothetical protein
MSDASAAADLLAGRSTLFRRVVTWGRGGVGGWMAAAVWKSW